MEVVKHFCKFFTCPNPTDTAEGRRRLLDANPYYSPFASRAFVNVTKKYVKNKNGEKIFTMLFEPKNKRSARGMICWINGVCACSEWIWSDIGVKYAELGFVVFMFDNVGHGRSDGDFVYLENFETQLVDQAIWLFDWAINKYIKSNHIYRYSIDNQNNYFLSGASMGGGTAILIATKLQERQDNKFKGVVIAAPLVRIHPDGIPNKCMFFMFNSVMRPLMPHARIVRNGTEASTVNEKLIKLQDESPVCDRNPFAIQTAAQLFLITQKVEKNIKKFKMPLFICHGDADAVTDYEASVIFYDQCGTDEKDKVLKIYEGRHHAVHCEEPDIYRDSVDWMMSRIQYKEAYI